LDLPPSAKAPVYNDKIYIKALRLPHEVIMTFKNDLYKKTTTSSDSGRQKNITNQNNNTNNNISNQNILNNNNDSSIKAPQSKSPNKVLISNNGISQPVNVNNNKQTNQSQKFNSQGGQKGIMFINQKSLICNQSKIIC